MLGLPGIFGGRHAFGHVRLGPWAICPLRGCLQATQNPARKKGAIKMGSTAISIVQVICLVFVVIMMVSVRRTLRDVNGVMKNLEEGLWEYTKATRVEMEARLKKVEDAIASLQKAKSKTDKRRKK